MATINYKDTKQFLSFVIKSRLFWGKACKKRKAEGKYLMSTKNSGSMGQPRMLLGIRNLRSMGQPRMLVGIRSLRSLRNLRNIGREHIVAIYQNFPSLISLISLITLILHHDYHHDLISCQSGVVVVHHKRDRPGIVHSSTALGGLLLGMCR